MLVKFDHLTYVVAECDLEETQKVFESNGYVLKFCERDLKNINTKMKFLSTPYSTHGLYFYESANGIPVELITYQKVNEEKSPNSYPMNGYAVDYHTKNKEELENLLRAIGVKMTERVELSGLMDKNKVYATIEQDENVTNVLDNKGFCCPTMIVDSYQKTQKAVTDAGFVCSETTELEVNGRKLQIFFASTKNNDIIELIALK